MKSKVEHTIKQQLEEREIPVSENAWDRLQEMMEEEKPASKRLVSRFWRTKLGISIAASVVLFIGLIWGLNSNSESVSNEMVANPVMQESNSIETKPENSFPVHSEELYTDSEIASTSQSKPIEKSYRVPTQEKLAKGIENTVDSVSEKAFTPIIEKNLPEIPNEPSSELVFQEETITEKTPKKNLVDPEMLLYSIENNEAVKQSKSNSKLVLYDFNK